jgi:hypothetical protein
LCSVWVVCDTYWELAQFITVVIAVRSERPESRASISGRDGRLFFPVRHRIGTVSRLHLLLDPRGRNGRSWGSSHNFSYYWIIFYACGSLHPLPHTSSNVLWKCLAQNSCAVAVIVLVNSLCSCTYCAQGYVLFILGLIDVALKFAQAI